MPQLETNILANIGQGGADIAGSMAKAYSLKDLIDTSQLNQMNLKRQQQESQEAEQIRTLSKNYDFGKEDDRSRFVNEVSRISGPQAGMKILKSFQDSSESALNLKHAQYQDLHDRLGVAQTAMAPLVQATLEAQAKGKTPAEINAMLMPMGQEAMTQAKGMTLANGKPAVGDEDLKMFSEAMQNPDIGSSLLSLFKQTKDGRDQIQQYFQQQNLQSEAANRGKKVETVEGDPNKFPGTQAGKYYKVEFSPDGKSIVLGGAQPTTAMINLQQGGPSAPNAAGATRGGVLSAMTDMGASFPPGFRSPKVQRETINAALKAHPDETNAQIAQRIRSGNINITADTSGARAFGTQAAKISVAEEEINQTAPLVIAAAEKVNASNFVPWAKLVTMGESQIADTNLRQYKIYITSLMNAYDQLAARGGTDVAKREHAREMLSSADSPKMAKAAIDAILQEVKAASRATESAKQRLRGGPAEQVAPPPPAGAPAAPPSPQSPAGAGAAPFIKETTSEADYASVPSGGWYRKPGDPPGSHRVKQ
jgi:hypothetical protein